MMQSEIEPKFCKDCKHHSRRPVFDRCDLVLDPIDGSPGAFCDMERDGSGWKTNCGAQGRHFEPKPPKRSLLRFLGF